MIDVDRLDIRFEGDRVGGFSGGNEIIITLESRLNRKLPKAYLEFLRKADGGYPQVDCFHASCSGGDEVFGINNFFSLANPGVELIFDELEDWGITIGNGNLPIARDGGGNIIYLDLNSEAETVWLYLCVEEEKVLVASSFEGFIDGLFSDFNYLISD